MRQTFAIRRLGMAAAMVFSAGIVQICAAQVDAAPLTRKEVKAETRAARDAGELMPAGEQSARQKPFVSSKTRAQRKSETLSAERAGKLLPAGEGEKSIEPVHSNKTRRERKAETLAAAKAGQLMPPGEMNDVQRRGR